jgi:hypothetical protein
LGDIGGSILSFAGAIVSYFCPPLGIAMMVVGGIWSNEAAKAKMQEAMDRAARARAGMKTNARTSQMAIPVAYGLVRIGGNVVYMNTGGGLDNGEQKNLWLYQVIALSEGPLESMEEVWFNDQMVWQMKPGLTMVDSGYTGKGPPNSGRHNFSLDWRLGCNSQAIFNQINNLSPGGGYDILGNWATPADTEFNDAMPATALLFTAMRNYTNDGKDPSVWQSIPQVTAVVKGRRCRKLDNLNELAWTNNGPVVLFDIMTNPQYGWGLPSSKIDIASFISAASFCAASGTILTNTVTEVMTGSSVNKPYTYTEADTLSPASYSVLNFCPTSWYKSSDVRTARRTPWVGNSFSAVTWVGTETWSYVDSCVSSSTGAIFRISGTSTPQASVSSPVHCGSLSYTTGSISIQCSGEVVSSPNSALSPRYLNVAWGAGWGGIYNLSNQYIANSPTIRCGSEVLWESTSGVLLSTSGGWAKIDYTRGIVDFALGYTPGSAGMQIEARYQRMSHTGYSFNGYIMDAKPAIDVIREICAHFRGYIVYSQGVYRLQVDKAGTAVYSFDEDNIKAGTFQANQRPLSDRPNRVRVKFTDAANNYTPADVVYEVASPAIPISEAINESVLSLPYLTYREEAMRMAKTHAAQSQLGLNVEFETGFDGMAVEPGDLINITHTAVNWQDKTFRVVSTEETSEETVKIVAQEYDAAAYADEYL